MEAQGRRMEGGRPHQGTFELRYGEIDRREQHVNRARGIVE
jgi:hypothetical protein